MWLVSFLVRLDSIDFFFLVSVFLTSPHLASRIVPFLTSLVALALTGIISAKQKLAGRAMAPLPRPIRLPAAETFVAVNPASRLRPGPNA